jgi:uncharacterized protein (DUF1778 family)
MRDESVFVRVSVGERELVDQAAALSDVGPGVFGRKAILSAARRLVRQAEERKRRESDRERVAAFVAETRGVIMAETTSQGSSLRRESVHATHD